VVPGHVVHRLRRSVDDVPWEYHPVHYASSWWRRQEIRKTEGSTSSRESVLSRVCHSCGSFYLKWIIAVVIYNGSLLLLPTMDHWSCYLQWIIVFVTYNRSMLLLHTTDHCSCYLQWITVLVKINRSLLLVHKMDSWSCYLQWITDLVTNNGSLFLLPKMNHCCCYLQSITVLVTLNGSCYCSDFTIAKSLSINCQYSS